MLNSRYLFHDPDRNKAHQIFERDLYKDKTGEQLPWLTNKLFLQKYRMKRSSFWCVVDLIKDHPVLNLDQPGKKKWAPVPHQLLVW